jgi:hypothetical protein
LQWVQHQNHSKFDNLQNVRREASRYFTEKIGIFFKEKIGELETNSKIKIL